MLALMANIEDTQFNALRGENTWKITQCCPRTGKVLTIEATDEEFAATLALMIGRDSLEGSDNLYPIAESLVKKQIKAIKGCSDITSTEEQEFINSFRMIP